MSSLRRLTNEKTAQPGPGTGTGLTAARGERRFETNLKCCYVAPVPATITCTLYTLLHSPNYMFTCSCRCRCVSKHNVCGQR